MSPDLLGVHTSERKARRRRCQSVRAGTGRRHEGDAKNVPAEAAAVNFLADPSSSWIAPSLSPAISMVMSEEDGGRVRQARLRFSPLASSSSPLCWNGRPILLQQRRECECEELPRQGVTSMMMSNSPVPLTGQRQTELLNSIPM
jgi:hypothetical protein